ncbi:hypothetical protein KP509_07G003600 [Ceratopteris richardii]|uniref:Uncharacterized protein n=1 Tax=Ceratopteris richardii TaxID=49495 RepID=A0A8T2UBJ4_CERRI|nr:hypothetical protein KP509_07G003600 [Ceratopteris richardii]KAH7431999.1 hypothetical protein KP509_07G003600 [Ceratopteris richardii]
MGIRIPKVALLLLAMLFVSLLPSSAGDSEGPPRPQERPPFPGWKPPPQSPPPPPPSPSPPPPSPPPPPASPPPPPPSPPPPSPPRYWRSPPPPSPPPPPASPPPPSPPRYWRFPTLVVKGVVLCKRCKKTFRRTLPLGNKPLIGAEVQLVCKKYGNKVFAYDKSYTGAGGRFDLYVPNFNLQEYDPHANCRVLLGSSNSPFCAQKTFMNYSPEGAKLDFDGRYGGKIFYSVKPLAFTNC